MKYLFDSIRNFEYSHSTIPKDDTEAIEVMESGNEFPLSISESFGAVCPLSLAILPNLE